MLPRCKTTRKCYGLVATSLLRVTSELASDLSLPFPAPFPCLYSPLLFSSSCGPLARYFSRYPSSISQIQCMHFFPGVSHPRAKKSECPRIGPRGLGAVGFDRCMKRRACSKAVTVVIVMKRDGGIVIIIAQSIQAYSYPQKHLPSVEITEK